MKKILYVVFAMFLLNICVFARDEVQKGVYIDNVKLGDNSISYSIKIEKNSDLWNKYVTQKNIDDVEYFEGDFTINCETGKVKGNVRTFDLEGSLLNEAQTADVPNKDIFNVCEAIKGEIP